MDAKPSAECQRVQQGGRNVAGSARAKSPTGDGKRRGRGPARGANTSAAGKGPGVWPAAAGGGGYFRVRTSSPYKDRGDPVPIAADRPALRPLSRPARYETPDTNGPGDIGACQRVENGTSASRKASAFYFYFSVLSETRKAQFMRFHNRVLWTRETNATFSAQRTRACW